MKRAFVAAAHDAEVRRRLSSAGWVDRDAGVVRIPIEQAMETMAHPGQP